MYFGYPDNFSFHPGESSENTEKAEPTTSNDLSTGNADELKDAFSELEKPK